MLQVFKKCPQEDLYRTFPGVNRRLATSLMEPWLRESTRSALIHQSLWSDTANMRDERAVLNMAGATRSVR
jgi:hypothetical protein